MPAGKRLAPMLTRRGAKVSKKHDQAATPFHRAVDHQDVTVQHIVALKRTYSSAHAYVRQRTPLRAHLDVRQELRGGYRSDE